MHPVARAVTPSGIRSPARRLTALAIGLLLGLGATLVASPAEASSRPVVKIWSAASSAPVGTTIKVGGSVSKKSRGATVSLQTRVGTGGWRTLASTRVSKKKTYGFGVRPGAGERQFRTVVAKTRTIRAAASRTISLTGRTSMPGTALTNPTPQLGDADQASADPAVARILADTNAFRVRNGKPPVRLSAPINAVAHSWARYLHDANTFKHNPDYSRQIPSGWTSAAENIAAGQVYTTVVQAWIDSPRHRENLLGDFTHMGVGYYEGPNGYKRYFVQNFARY